MSKEELLKRMEKSIVEGNKEEAAALAEEAIKENIDLNEVIEKALFQASKKSVICGRKASISCPS